MQEKLFIKNIKGLKLATIVEKPDKKGRFPCVLLLHGFKGYKEEANYSELAGKLLRNDIASVRFDASGFGESGGDFERDYRLTNYVKDAEIVYKRMLKMDFVDNKKVGVMGASMGGAQALILSANHPEIKAVISVSPPDIFATRDEFGKYIEVWRKKGFIEIESSRVGVLKVPFAYALDASKYDIGKFAEKIASPKLFILGLDDVTVVPDQTRSVFNRALKPKKLIEVEGMDHSYKDNPVILKLVNGYIVKYLKKYL